MDQEVRSGDILTALASLMGSQSHGMQSSQNNNNNSNPTNSMAMNGVAASMNLSNSTQVEATTAQVIDAHLLNMAGQPSSDAGGSSSASDAGAAVMERYSAFMNSNFPSANNGTTSHNSQEMRTDALFQAANQIGMAATDVGNVMDSRLPPYSANPIDFATSSHNQAIMEAFDGSSSGNLSCAQSYITLLQQQSADLWGGQSGLNSSMNVVGNDKQTMRSTRPQSGHGHGNNAQSSPGLDKATSHHILQSSSKSSMVMQHSSSRMGSSIKGSRGSQQQQQYSHNPSNSMQYDSGRFSNKNCSDLVLPVDNDGMQLLGNVVENCGTGREKKLTTTPIPSDAEKSSCSSTSSGSISGPEHSPDYAAERLSSSRTDVTQNVEALMDGSLPTHKGRDSRTMRAIQDSKNYPCYGNMNLVNFGTINFAPVMDGSHTGSMSPGDILRHGQDGAVLVPTSDSIIEIDEAVTSPVENIPMSPTTPTGHDMGGVMPQAFADVQKGNAASRGLFAQMQTVTAVQQVSRSQSAPRKSKTTEQSRKHSDGRKVVDTNNNTRIDPKMVQGYDKNFTSLSTVTQDKQKRHRSSDHHPNNQQDQFSSNIYERESAQYSLANVTEASSQGSHLKPKANADPTIRLKQTYNFPVQTHGRQHPQSNSVYTPGYVAKQMGSGSKDQSYGIPGSMSSNMMASSVVPSGTIVQQSPGQPRQWQTVTAVQGLKLPPILSEQDRIPKRGRPSKKMMQKNLKIHKNNASTSKNSSILPVSGTQPAPPKPQPLTQPPVTSPNLVSTYTINGEGLMEEIAPKLKENRRSKERTQAFMKYLDEIKTSSKYQQLVTNQKPNNEKEGPNAEGQKKKSSRPRSKVFGGRQSVQPLTESGITETMCTFSALAQQFKISNSILERATENLLKSAASKKSKELQHQNTAGQNRQYQDQHIMQPGKNPNQSSPRLSVENNNTNKGVSSVSSHCEAKPSSKVKIVPTAKQVAAKKAGSQPATRNSTPATAKVSETSQSQLQTETLPSSVKVSATVGQRERTSTLPKQKVHLGASKDSARLPQGDKVSEAASEPVQSKEMDQEENSVKGKHKKKKHKKHKKHKYTDSSAGKKKKKDKERKKKTKKKMKDKLTPSIIPSSSVSLVKPATNSALVCDGDVSGVKKLISGTPPPDKTSGFSSSFRNTESVDLENASSWPQDDAMYDAEDSSSDENSASPKPYRNTSSEPFSTPVSTSALTSFAQYSDERIGFGTFSIPMQKSTPRTPKPQKDISTGPALNVSENVDGNFGSRGMARSSKRHSKHKKGNKKLFRKSKACDPAFLAILDGLLVSMKEMKLDPLYKMTQLRATQSSTNIFLSTTVTEKVSASLWRSPPASSISGKSSSAAKSASSLLPKSGLIGGLSGSKTTKKSEFRLRKSKSLAQISESGNAVDSVSVFCCSSFFQAYGYVAPAEPSQTVPSRNQLSNPTKKTCTAQAGVKKVSKPTAKPIESVPSETTAKPKALPQENERSDQPSEEISNGEALSEAPQARKKRGWPRGKRRGPRSKKRRFEEPLRSQLQTNSEASVVQETSRDTGIESAKSQKKKSSENITKTAHEHKSQYTSDERLDSGVPALQTPVPSDSSSLVDASLLQQVIEQAIEANVPKHPGVNKDAITKSVDAAVQSYLQRIKNSQTMPNSSGAESEVKRKPKRKLSKTASSEGTSKVSEDTSPKANPDIHPKKLWACKHQDMDSSATLKAVSGRESASSMPKKRGPGRPRKNPIPDSTPLKHPTPKLSTSSVRQGKVPTASATVVPTKRKVLTVRIRGKCAKPAAKRLAARAKSEVAKRELPKPKPLPPVSASISRESALSCLSALCSIKAAKVLAKSGDKDVMESGLYAGTDVDGHLAEAIEMTVAMYSWDSHKRFEEACSTVEREMGIVDEFDIVNGDNRPRVATTKKSIESIVEKLKSKQTRSIHSAASALLKLHAASSSREDDENDEEDCAIIVDGNRSKDSCEKHGILGRQQDNSEKVSNQSSKLYKVKTSRMGGGASAKRPRGRPKRQSEEAMPPSKKQKRSEDSRPPSAAASRDGAYLSEYLAKKVKERQGNKIKLNKSDHEMDPVLSPRKPYLTAGLYSSTFKKDPKSSKSGNQCSSEDLLRFRPKLPPPLDAGLFLRRTTKDFQLPFDVFWMYKRKKISASQDPSNNFVKITENVYIGPMPSISQPGDHVCSCNSQNGENCGKQCLNRLMYIECQPSSCPCGSSCLNRVIQKREWCKSLERFKTKARGLGIRTTQAISEGAFILEYVGEVMSEAEFRARTIELYHAYNNHYCVQLDTSMVIDGYRMANEGRFVNHSCEPNCEMQKWCVNGEHRIGLFALRDIGPNEELTYFYNFHAYNNDTRQECRCGSQKCRGFIGGHTQRLTSVDSDASLSSLGQQPTSSSTPKTHGKRSKLKAFKSKDEETMVREFSTLQMKPIPKRERQIIKSRQLFLLRNLSQVRRKEVEHRRKLENKSGTSSSSTKSSHGTKPRKSHQSKEQKEKLVAALTEMYTAIATCKDQNGVSVAIPFMNLPSKKKNPEYYERISDPIDLSIIERNIVSNHYKDVDTFNSDVQRVFKNAKKYHGKKSTLGKDVFRLRKAYANARTAAMQLLNGQKELSRSSEASDEDMGGADGDAHRRNEDLIRCICCIYKDEGVMVQCEKCYVWQHCDCIGIDPDSMDRYLCEECDPRPYSREVKVIPPPPDTPPGYTYYLTLLRDELLVKQGDCVYLMREHRLRSTSSASSVRASHKNLAGTAQAKLDIFRIDQLWTDERGDKYVYGHHFLRPHETHHAPSRTFYQNELFASPVSEIVSLEAVVGHCCVMDFYTYCKGKPKDAQDGDLYICDYRTDKTASSFTRITKKRYPTCTKPHVFDTYEQKLCPKKDFQPHQVPDEYRRAAGRPRTGSSSSEQELGGKTGTFEDDVCEHAGSSSDKPIVESSAWKKKERIDGIANKLLSKLPKQAVDVSYLLEPGNGKRNRRKTQLSLESMSQQK